MALAWDHQPTLRQTPCIGPRNILGDLRHSVQQATNALQAGRDAMRCGDNAVAERVTSLPV
jgi:hypothetical protein